MAAVRIVQIPTDKVGLIIGFKGSTLRELSRMTGIFNITFNPRFKNDNGTYSLTINGVHNKAVERVVDEVERIFAVIRHSEIFSTLYCWNGKAYESAEIKLELHNGKGSLPLKAQAYKIKSISPNVAGLSPSVAGLSQAGSVFTSGETFMQGYDDTKVENIFKEALNQKMGSTAEFIFSLGEELFNHFGYGPSPISLPVRNGRVMMQDLTERDLKGFWSVFLDPSLSSRIAKGLEETGFNCLNKDSPEEYTKVRVLVLSENVKKYVVLALDKDLNSLAPEADSRLSDDKENAIKQILSAKTLNDVLPAGSSLKMSFKKMSLKVHPDKNSHPGAKDAFKKLNDAFERLSTGSRGSEPALEITSTPSRLTGKPPMVISATYNFTKVSTVTMVTEKELDIRAYLNSFDTEEDELSERIKNVLNNYWENMDSKGWIADPDGRTVLKVELVKQIQDRIYYAKEVIFQGKPEILEVVFYKMRIKLYGDDWSERQEIDINFGDSSSSFTGHELAERFLFVKNWWENFNY